MVRTRLKVLLVLLTAPFAILLGRLSTLQLVPETCEAYQRLSQHRTRAFLTPRRGRILARDGSVLVGNQPVRHLHFEYATLNPRAEPLAILVEELTKRSSFPPPEEIEARILALAPPHKFVEEARDHEEGDAAYDPWFLLVENVDPEAKRALSRRWGRYPGVFEVRPAGDETTFAVWFRARAAVRLETTLLHLERLLVPKETAATLARRVAETLAGIERRVANEVRRDREDGVPGSLVAQKARETRGYYWRQSWRLAADLPLDVVTEVEYHPERYPGILCVDDIRREYPLREACGTLLGHLRRLDADEVREDALEAQGRILDSSSTFDDLAAFDAARRVGFRRTDLIGTGGLEEVYDAELRGLHGMALISVDRRGRPRETLATLPPEHGPDLRATIDPALQKLIYEALERAVKPLGGPAGGSAAAAAVMEVETGALLASVGFPGVDPERLRESGYAEELNARWGAQTRSWFLDRPSAMPLFPGSVFKIIVAAAAMESEPSGKEAFDPTLRIPCHHQFDASKSLTCDALNGHTPSRDVNLVEALQYSCNIYFYSVGLRHLGVDYIQPWAANFGYGRPTGVDLPPREAEKGRLDAADKAREIWQICHYSIGQGFVEATPLQVLRSVAAIATGGRFVPRPHLIRPGPHDALRLRNTRTVEAIREGLWRVGHAPEGTASRQELGLRPFNAAFKTGTAEVESREGMVHHAWLVGFAPYEQPRIAFVAVVERTTLHGAEAAGPIVRQILKHFAAQDPAAYVVATDGGRE